MKYLLIISLLLLSLSASANGPVFARIAKSVWMNGDYMVVESCWVYEDHADIMIDDVYTQKKRRKEIKTDVLWTRLIDHASDGQLVPDPTASFWNPIEVYAFREAKQVVLKGFDQKNKPVMNTMSSSAVLIETITSLCQ